MILKALNPPDILPVLSKAHRWLIVIDEADRAAGGILALIQRLPTELQGARPFPNRLPRHRLAVVRQQDQNWASVSVFKPERMAGLLKQDAEAIVKAWADFGEAGLGDLATPRQSSEGIFWIAKSTRRRRLPRERSSERLVAVRHGN